MIPKTKRVLAVDDEPHMRRLLEITLKQAGYQPILAADGKEALLKIRQENVDLVVSDLHMPGMDGMALLQHIRQDNTGLPFIMITAQGEIKTAVASMKLGASDYILRPFDLETLELAIERALSISRLQLENQYLKAENTTGLDNIIGQSAPIQALLLSIKQLAPEKATALLVGETGTGKELVAQAIHRLSPRKNALFVAINCAAIPSEMLESELFGHEKGAFTGAIKERVGKFELADEGTLFLDEITEMPMHLQAKLLRALQEGTIERLGSNRPLAVDNRIIAATNSDPLLAIKEGKLREDLFYRLNVFQMRIPPLRERREDIVLLTKHFLAKRQLNITESAIKKLQHYDWPGNVRELQNVLERAAIIAGQAELDVQHLPQDMIKDTIGNDVQKMASDSPTSLSTAVENLERKMIEQALNESQDNKTRAAKLLQISERSLWYKLKTYGIR